MSGNFKKILKFSFVFLFVFVGFPASASVVNPRPDYSTVTSKQEVTFTLKNNGGVNDAINFTGAAWGLTSGNYSDRLIAEAYPMSEYPDPGLSPANVGSQCNDGGATQNWNNCTGYTNGVFDLPSDLTAGDGDYFVVFYERNSGVEKVVWGGINKSGSTYTPIPLPGGVVTDTTTHFVSFNPELGSTTATSTSSQFRIGATGVVSSSDFEASSTNLYIRFMQQTGAGVRGNSVLLSHGEFTIPITASSTVFDLSTTTSILSTGVYQVYFAIQKPRFSLFGFSFFTTTLKSVIGTFIVGTSTSQSEIDSVQILTETTGGGLVDTVVPTDETASSTVLGLGRAFGLVTVALNKFPINWVVEYANVLTNLASSTATTTIPAVTVDYSSLHTLQSIPTTTPQSLRFTFFSSATLDQVGSMAGVQAGRTLLGYMLWFTFMLAVWRRVSGLFSSAQ